MGFAMSKRYKQILASLPTDTKGNFLVIDLMKALRSECSRVETLQETLAMYNRGALDVRDGKKNKCKTKSMRSPAVIKRSVKAVLAR
jgi:hypothetical protein